MLLLKAKFLEVKELPAREPFPPSSLITVLSGTETFTLIAPQDLASQIGHIEEFEDIELSLKVRDVNLSQYGAKGRAYRLSVKSLVGGGS